MYDKLLGNFDTVVAHSNVPKYHCFNITVGMLKTTVFSEAATYKTSQTSAFWARSFPKINGGTLDAPDVSS